MKNCYRYDMGGLLPGLTGVTEGDVPMNGEDNEYAALMQIAKQQLPGAPEDPLQMPDVANPQRRARRPGMGLKDLLPAMAIGGMAGGLGGNAGVIAAPMIAMLMQALVNRKPQAPSAGGSGQSGGSNWLKLLGAFGSGTTPPFMRGMK